MEELFRKGDIVGLVGVGKLGTALQEQAMRMGCELILCDPPRALVEVDELSESFFDLWGNGMGGCQLSNAGMHPFVPLENLSRATVISIQVPVTSAGNYPTASMMTSAFLRKCRPDARILCWSPLEVFAPDARQDARIRLMRR